MPPAWYVEPRKRRAEPGGMVAYVQRERAGGVRSSQRCEPGMTFALELVRLVRQVGIWGEETGR